MKLLIDIPDETDAKEFLQCVQEQHVLTAYNTSMKRFSYVFVLSATGVMDSGIEREHSSGDYYSSNSPSLFKPGPF